MTAVARLSFWIAPERLDEFTLVYDDLVVPILQRHGWVEAASCQRIVPQNLFSRLFAVETPALVRQQKRDLENDSTWQSALQRLSTTFATANEDLRYCFDLYTAPIGPGKTIDAAYGMRQKLWQTFNVQDGLPSSLIFALLQDRQGHLWIATYQEGVCRYDGSQFTTFTMDDGLGDNSIIAMLEDSQGRIWFGPMGNELPSTRGGLSYYDGERFAVFSVEDGLVDNATWSILEDRRGHLWFTSDKGASRYDGHQFTPFTTTNGIADNYILRLVEDRRGHLWFIHGENGMTRYDGQQFIPYGKADGLAHDAVYAALEDSRGNMWFTTEAGISRYDGQQFTSFTGNGDLGCGKLASILEDRHGHLWFSTKDQGVLRYNGRQFEHLGPAGGALCPMLEDQVGTLWFIDMHTTVSKNTFHLYNGVDFTPLTSNDGLAHNRIECLVASREGHIWAGTWGGGLNRYDGSHFTSFTTDDGLGYGRVEILCQDQQGHLWFGTWGGGLNRYDDNRIETFTTDDGLGDNQFWSILEDSQGRMWFGTFEGGVSYYDGKNFTTFTTDDGLADNSVWAICEDRRGHMWFGTQKGGISHYDGKNFTTFTTDDGLADNGVWSIVEDQQGHIWCSIFNNGIARYDGEKFTTFTTDDGLAHNQVWYLLIDSQGHLWCATWGGGVSCYDGEKFTNFTTDDGLAHNSVRTMCEDSRGHMWFGTYGAGISRYDGRVFQNVSRKDGLVHDAVQHIIQARDGAMWIATEGGVTCYRPPDRPPSIRLKGIIADQNYESVDTLSIPSSQQFAIFEFQGSSFTTHPDWLVYVYRLSGYDDDWRTSYTPRAEYRNLPVGTYTLLFRAVDRDLNYSVPAKVELVVHPDAREDRIEALEAQLSQPQGTEQFLGQSTALQNMLQQIHAVADTDVTALILGETGTGKGLVARAIYSLSSRRDHSFIQVNCGAIPEGLVESELFGHEKGAFTGAIARKIGRFELADGGTLFLDEIGDLPLESQRVLLQVLQDGTFHRVGGQEEIRVDVRVLAATNRDLQVAMQEGTFREDLFFRLSVFALDLPPLRERREDVPLLIHYFVEQFAQHLHRPVPEIDTAVLTYLQNYAWPGNVRELEHLVQRAILVCHDNVIRLTDIPLLEGTSRSTIAAEQRDATAIMALDDQEKQLIERALKAANWIVYGDRGAARLLSVHPERLRAKMRKYSLKRPHR